MDVEEGIRILTRLTQMMDSKMEAFVDNAIMKGLRIDGPECYEK